MSDLKSEHRVRECGSSMFVTLLGLAWVMGSTLVASRVNTDDEAALRMYRKTGFTVGEKTFIGHGQTKLMVTCVNR